MSGSAGHWSAKEDALLHELPWGAQLIYLRGLRRHVSSDGTVGVHRRISRRALIETLTVPQRRGRHATAQETPTVSMVRHLLSVLIDAGLIIPLPAAVGMLVFRLPYAPQGQSVPRMSSRKSDPMSDPMSDRAESFFDAGFEHGCDPMSDPTNSRMSGPHQSKAVIGNTSSAYRSPERAPEPTMIGTLCGRLRREASMMDANPHRAELAALISEGIEIDQIVGTAVELAGRGKGPPNVGYLASTVRGRIRDAQHSEVTYAGSISRRASVCEQIEQQDREAREREHRGPYLTVVN